MKNIVLILMIALAGCHGRKQLVSVSCLDLKDSTRIEANLDAGTLKAALRQIQRTERRQIQADEKKAVTESNNEVRNNAIHAKADVKNNRIDSGVEKGQTNADVKKEKAKAGVEKAKAKWLPNTLKWGSAFLLVLLGAFIYIKKKTSILTKIKSIGTWLFKIIKS